MSSYTQSEIERYLVLDRALTEHIDKIEFHANGSADITFRDGYKCSCCDIHAAAQLVRHHIDLAAMKTSVSVARQLLQQHLPNLQAAQEFKQWLHLRLIRDMGGQDTHAEFYESAQFEQTLQVFQDTTFHVVEGRHSWETNLPDYFRRKATDAQWLEDLYHLC